eukprot:m.7700 g.7700  ORF g.7700 m.7700 type:complete len:753 (+) comp3025_c0_seq1:637-2895(+)
MAAVDADSVSLSSTTSAAGRVRASNIVKLACIRDGKFPVLLDFDQNAPLAEIITNICGQWGIAGPEQYSFKSDDTQKYITEKTRHALRDGAVLKLALSPGSLAARFVSTIAGRDPNEKMQALQDLRVECKDSTFGNKFAGHGGIPALAKVIVDSNKSGDKTNLGFALSSYGELFAHKLIEAETLPEDFVKMMLQLTRSDNPTVARSALKVASLYLRNASKGFPMVSNALPVRYIVDMAAKASDAGLHEGCLAVANGIIQCCPLSQVQAVYQSLEQHRAVESFNIRMAKALEEHRRGVGAAEDRQCFEDSWAHELSAFQQLWLNRLFDSSRTPYSKEYEAELMSLKKHLPEVEEERDPRRRKASDSGQWTRLGFDNPEDPSSQFQESPGVLALNCMAYFSRTYQESFVKLVLEQLSRNEYACPIAKTSCALVTTLLELFRIGQPPTEKSTSFMPLFYSSQHAFREIFCVGVQLACKTWREMEAKAADFAKVINVVRKQLEHVMLKSPEDQPRTTEELKAAVFAIPYSEMQHIEQVQMERRQRALRESEPVKLLKQKLRGELEELVRAQKLARLSDGAWFYPILKGKIKKDMRFFCTLSPNYKTLHWDDPVTGSDNTKPKIHQLSHQCDVGALKQIFAGNDVPAIVAKGKKLEESVAPLVFSLLGSGEASLEEGLGFCARDRAQAAVWLDGLRVLTRAQLSEPESAEDLDILLSLEMHLRLLNLHGVHVDELSPVVPPLPADFDFCEEQADSSA